MPLYMDIHRGMRNVVCDLCVGKARRFVDQGLRTLKGVDEPVRAHEVAWR
jgi:hypothetical protein